MRQIRTEENKEFEVTFTYCTYVDAKDKAEAQEKALAHLWESSEDYEQLFAIQVSENDEGGG